MTGPAFFYKIDKMLKSFDRCLLKEITPPFFLGLVVYSFVLLMNQVFILSELFIAKGVSFAEVAQIFLYLVPSVLVFRFSKAEA